MILIYPLLAEMGYGALYVSSVFMAARVVVFCLNFTARGL